MKLTKQQKRVKIAEACGWKIKISKPLLVCDGKQGGALLDGEGGKRGFLWIAPGDTLSDHTCGLPDYFNDLNAMHKAWEKAIKGNGLLEDKYSIELLRAIGSDDPSDGTRPNGSDATWSLASNATSSQRFRAFGLTLNLWTPDQ